jgi:hypothetical protein
MSKTFEECTTFITENAEDFTQCSSLYSANDLINISKPYNIIHFYIFLQDNKDIQYILLNGHFDQHQNQYVRHLYFLDKKQLKIFRAWWHAYKRRYFNSQDPESIAPQVMALETVRGMVVRLKDFQLEAVFDRRGLERDTCHHWLWILENCKDKAYNAFGCWIFKNRDDAMLFKLNFA